MNENYYIQDLWNDYYPWYEGYHRETLGDPNDEKSDQELYCPQTIDKDEEEVEPEPPVDNKLYLNTSNRERIVTKDGKHIILKS